MKHLVRSNACCVLYLLMFPLLGQGSETPAPKYFWSQSKPDTEKNYYVAFRGNWELASERDCEILILGASWFVVWLDGAYFCEGPARFPAAFPEYQTYSVHLPAGHHVLAIQVHHVGEVTRMMENIEPFLFCVVKGGKEEISLVWKCVRLEAYESQVARINPELGYMEWCDTRMLPAGWRDGDFNDAAWNEPVIVSRELGPMKPLSTHNVRSVAHQLEPVASGEFANVFGYEKDNPPARFFLCDLSPENIPPQGLWRRYDLGHVRLMRPRFVFNLPEGAVVEFAYCEELKNGRVTPWITLSAGESTNMDHYVARGGEQEFFPLTPKGGRFVEVHVYALPGQIQFIKQEIIERCYFGEAEGAFHTEDTLLNEIWSVGVRTLRSCSEDAPIDNPTRERGQWLADVATVGMDIAASVFSDLRLIRRALVQSAECARQDGLVAGLCPGGTAFLSTFAAQWVTACVHYWQLSGDLKLLDELFPYAASNIEAFEMKNTTYGLDASLGWGFVDWGYVPNPGPSDMGVNLHYLAALRDMATWCEAIGKVDHVHRYKRLADMMDGKISRYFESEFRGGEGAWDRIGYHRAVLGMKLGFFRGHRQRECTGYIRKHMLNCFPNDSAAPRLSDPGANNKKLITPYFAHYALPLLIEHGEMSFVLEQYRKCWGWALGQGLTTWPEVFDLRWSHCHQWAGCPTWQLSRYSLGLQPRYDLGKHNYELKLFPGSLQKANGLVPLPGGEGVIRIEWSRDRDGLRYHLETPVPIDLHLDEERYGAKSSLMHIEREIDMIFKNLQ